MAALLALPPRADPDTVLSRLAAGLRPRLDAGDVIGAGSVVESVTAVQRSFLEADQVAEVAVRTPAGLPFYRLPDLRLRGLLHLLRDDPRLQAFAERELAPLLRHDHAAGSQGFLLPAPWFGWSCFMRLLDELLTAFVAQGRMKLPGSVYQPCYRLVA